MAWPTDGQPRAWLIRIRNSDVLARLEPARSEAWRKLTLAVLHRYLIDELLTAGPLGGQPPQLIYTPSSAEAIRLARSRRALAFLVPPPPLQALQAVCQAGDLMPHKSTYFYPKLATGLVINPLY